MPPRSSWKGYLRLSLVSVPVQAFNAAASDGGEIHFNQLHKKCHNRIRYQKVCPEHGEVPNDEIVMGYEYAKGQYVVMDDPKVGRRARGGERAIHIDTFVEPDTIDPVYFDGRTYYLTPDGAVGQKPYAVLLKAMADERKWGVGRASLFEREQLVLIRPRDKLLCAEMLYYATQVRKQSDVEGDVALQSVSKEELNLAAKLIEASIRPKFNIASYEDQATNQLKAMIEAKIEGRETVALPEEEEAPVINLMDALRKSVAQTKSKPRKAPSATPSGKKPRRRTSSRRTA